jgi:hypothetical protein
MSSCPSPPLCCSPSLSIQRSTHTRPKASSVHARCTCPHSTCQPFILTQKYSTQSRAHPKHTHKVTCATILTSVMVASPPRVHVHHNSYDLGQFLLHDIRSSHIQWLKHSTHNMCLKNTNHHNHLIPERTKPTFGTCRTIHGSPTRTNCHCSCSCSQT